MKKQMASLIVLFSLFLSFQAVCNLSKNKAFENTSCQKKAFQFLAQSKLFLEKSPNSKAHIINQQLYEEKENLIFEFTFSFEQNESHLESKAYQPTFYKIRAQLLFHSIKNIKDQDITQADCEILSLTNEFIN